MSLVAKSPNLSRLDPSMKKHELVDILIIESFMRGEPITKSKAERLVKNFKKAAIFASVENILGYSDPTANKAVRNVLRAQKKNPAAAKQSQSSFKKSFSVSS